MAGLTPLGDLINVKSRQKLHEVIEAKADELGRQFGLTMMERNEIATRMFVAVLQTDVVRELSEDEEETAEYWEKRYEALLSAVGGVWPG